jgi:hypothetical protein
MRNNRYFLYENPSGTELFDQPECTFSRHPTAYVRKGHGCMHGIVGADGLLMAKALLWISNSPTLLDYVAIKCSGDHPHSQEWSGRQTK